VLDLLDLHLARLGLLDPQRSVRVAIAGHSLRAILAGISVFDAKLTAKTLPDGVDARYLLGIVKNVDAQTARRPISGAPISTARLGSYALDRRSKSGDQMQGRAHIQVWISLPSRNEALQ
jgi:hypothetical protein